MNNKLHKFLVEVHYVIVVMHRIDAETPEEAATQAVGAGVPDGDAEIGEPVGVTVYEAT